MKSLNGGGIFWDVNFRLPLNTLYRSFKNATLSSFHIFQSPMKYFVSCFNYVSHEMTQPIKWVCAQRRLRSAWASAQSDQSSLFAWIKLGSLATHWAHSEESDQTGRMPRLIWVFAGRTLILLVLSCRGSCYHERMSSNVTTAFIAQLALTRSTINQSFKNSIVFDNNSF